MSIFTASILIVLVFVIAYLVGFICYHHFFDAEWTKRFKIFFIVLVLVTIFLIVCIVRSIPRSQPVEKVVIMPEEYFCLEGKVIFYKKEDHYYNLAFVTDNGEIYLVNVRGDIVPGKKYVFCNQR